MIATENEMEHYYLWSGLINIKLKLWLLDTAE